MENIWGDELFWSHCYQETLRYRMPQGFAGDGLGGDVAKGLARAIVGFIGLWEDTYKRVDRDAACLASPQLCCHMLEKWDVCVASG